MPCELQIGTVEEKRTFLCVYLHPDGIDMANFGDFGKKEENAFFFVLFNDF